MAPPSFSLDGDESSLTLGRREVDCRRPLLMFFLGVHQFIPLPDVRLRDDNSFRVSIVAGHIIQHASGWADGGRLSVCKPHAGGADEAMSRSPSSSPSSWCYELGVGRCIAYLISDSTK